MKLSRPHPWLVVGFGIGLVIAGVMVVPLFPLPGFLYGCTVFGCVPAALMAVALPFMRRSLRSRAQDLDRAPTDTFTKLIVYGMAAFVIIYILVLLVVVLSGAWGADWSWI